MEDNNTNVDSSAGQRIFVSLGMATESILLLNHRNALAVVGETGCSEDATGAATYNAHVARDDPFSRKQSASDRGSIDSLCVGVSGCGSRCQTRQRGC